MLRTRSLLVAGSALLAASPALLPMESHSYAARENLLHMLWEQDTWLENYVKGATK